MPRMSKSHPMTGSLKKSDGTYRIAYFVWKEDGYYVKDAVAKKVWGPFANVGAAQAAGVEFHADGGRRAEKQAETPAPAVQEPETAEV